MTKWTTEQSKAIDARSGNFLVSASAGSGKTAVLTERVFQLILEGTKLSEFLVLTFTNNAAAVMRDRIRQKLEDLRNPKYDSIVASIDSAAIQTYDAFALNLVKKYHDRLGLSADVNLVDATLIELQERKLLNSILSEFYKARDPKVLKLIGDYCSTDDNDLKDFILKIAHKSELKEDKYQYLKTYINQHYDENKIKEDVNTLFKNTIHKIDEYISLAKLIENPDYAGLVIEYLEEMKSCSTIDELLIFLKDETKKIPNAPKGTLTDLPESKAHLKTIREGVKSIKERFPYISEKQIVMDEMATKENVETLISITLKLFEKIDAYKAKYNVYSFADIFKFAYLLAKDPYINKELKDRFKYIMIDEYQDTSDIQEKFINLIEKDNVYVVGDVKQSIYKFRNADCEIFLKKFNEYKTGKGGTRYELPHNFRCRQEVVDCVNKIYDSIMTRLNTGIDYKNEHRMLFKNDVYTKHFDPAYSYEAEFINYDEHEGVSAAEYEANLIATDIRNKIQKKIFVYDDKLKDNRPIDYKDFAILCSTKTNFPVFQKVFNEYKIPLFASFDRSIKDNDLTLVYENIIKAIYLYRIGEFKKPFIHAFVSIMRSFLFAYKDDEIESIVTLEKFDTTDVFDLIKKTSDQILTMNLEDSVKTIIDNFQIYKKIVLIGDENINSNLLNYYLNIAKQMDTMGFDLETFAQYFDDLEELEVDAEFSSTADVENCVKLLTIHASKGMEFKFVYLPQLNHEFNMHDCTDKLLVDRKYGISVPNVNTTYLTTFYHDLIGNKEKMDTILEQLRVFYVAITRAEEKVIFVGNLNYRVNPISLFSKASCFMDFIALSSARFSVYSITPEFKEIYSLDEGKERCINVHESVNLGDKKMVINRASKTVSDDIDETLLKLGKKYHYYLELVDMKTKNTDFIKNKKDKYFIDKFLKQSVFDKANEAKIRHEFKFFDEQNKVNGSIDLLLIYSDHIDIIDFKLSHVSDKEYDKQLAVYKNYIKQISDLPIHTYVTGIFSGEVRQID